MPIAATHRYEWLDALRGLAALTVVFTHASVLGLYQVEPWWTYAQLPPLRILWTGHQSVIVFFVLSGFALYLLIESAKPSYRRFLASRFFRLYLPYVVSLAIAVAILSTAKSLGGPWPRPLAGIGDFDPGVIVGHLILVGTVNDAALNPPIWSLVYEARLALVFPVIFWLTSRLSFPFLAIPVALSIVLSLLQLNQAAYDYINEPVHLDIIKTVHYATLFFIGAYLARYRVVVALGVRKLSPAVKGMALAIAVVLFLYTYDFTWPFWPRFAAEMGTALAAAIFIAIMALWERRVPAVLTWLGSVSFSLYLTHFLVFEAVALLAYDRVPLPVSWVLMIGGSLVVAGIFGVLVEAPSRRAARAVQSVRRVARPEIAASPQTETSV